ncbi:MAG: hypothetical protein DWQ01_01500 [Planctomycetota bacterium]|nr:MAG: hypothetical protein DWQ01_01500 [Planctomycetota bacterium]
MAARASSRTRRRAGKRPWWLNLSYEELLQVRICDLKLDIRGTALEARVERLNAELHHRGLCFRPYIWLSTDWFTPDHLTGFAIPFFLAHPRLARLEYQQMFEVEGGGHAACMKLLRHETGHAIDHAFGLHRRKRWREVFGKVSQPYRTTYTPNPRSRSFVLHLDHWYSHSHPLEDFAETFAVWLQPRAQWRRRYRDWPALKKLQFVDEWMAELAGQKAPTHTREKPDSLSKLRFTLAEYYQRRKTLYRNSASDEHDRQLLRVFSKDPAYRRRETAVAFLKRNRTALRSRVSFVTGYHRYGVDQALNIMITRCRELGLRKMRAETESRMASAVFLTVLTTDLLRGTRRPYQR